MEDIFLYRLAQDSDTLSYQFLKDFQLNVKTIIKKPVFNCKRNKGE